VTGVGSIVNASPCRGIDRGVPCFLPTAQLSCVRSLGTGDLSRDRGSGDAENLSETGVGRGRKIFRPTGSDEAEESPDPWAQTRAIRGSSYYLKAHPGPMGSHRDPSWGCFLRSVGLAELS